MAIIWDSAFDKRQKEMEELGEAISKAAKEDNSASGREALDILEREEEERIVFSTAFD